MCWQRLHLTNLGCAWVVVLFRSRPNTCCASLLHPPVEVIASCHLSPALGTVSLKVAARTAWQLIRIITTVVLEVADLCLVHTVQVFTHVLVSPTTWASRAGVEAKRCRGRLTWQGKGRLNANANCTNANTNANANAKANADANSLYFFSWLIQSFTTFFLKQTNK